MTKLAEVGIMAVAVGLVFAATVGLIYVAPYNPDAIMYWFWRIVIGVGVFCAICYSLKIVIWTLRFVVRALTWPFRSFGR